MRPRLSKGIDRDKIAPSAHTGQFVTQDVTFCSGPKLSPSDDVYYS